MKTTEMKVVEVIERVEEVWVVEGDVGNRRFDLELDLGHCERRV
jgi:hypothetical protein